MLCEPHSAPRHPARAWRLAAGFLLLSTMFGFGCGGESVPPLYPVRGKVTVEGAPLTSGQVSLVAEPTPTTPVPSSGGKIESDGSYEIVTAGRSGAPLGKYKVRVTPLTVPTKGGAPALTFDKKYTDPKTSGLDYEVVASPQPGQYDLKLTK